MLVLRPLVLTVWADALDDEGDGVGTVPLGQMQWRHLEHLHTVGVLAPLAVEVYMLILTETDAVASAELIVAHASPVLKGVDDVMCQKECQHP